MLLLQLLLRRRNSQYKSSEEYHWLGNALVNLRDLVKRNFNFLIFLLTCYIVASRLGPVVSRAGDLAVEVFQVERLIVREFDSEGLELFRGALSRFRLFTRTPYPGIVFGRATVELEPVATTMGNIFSSRRSQREDSCQPTPESSEQSTSPRADKDTSPSSQSDASPLTQPPPPDPAITTEEGEGVEEGGGGGGEKREKSTSPGGPEPLPLKKLQQLRNESEFSLHVGSTESLVGLFGLEHLNPSDYKKPIKFKKIQPTIKTGDLALLYRRGQTTPHIAVFINHVEADPLFPLLLVKAKTKPLPLEKFRRHKPRFIHPITATTRIFYGDYEKVAIQYMQSGADIDSQIAMDAIAKVESIPFSEKECSAIAAAESDHERSLLLSAFMAAYYYKELGLYTGAPDEVDTHTLLEQLPLSDPLYVKLPTMKPGPMVLGEPPFLKQLLDGVYPQQDVTLQPYEQAIEGLDTGDIVLFSGATSQGAIIKFFDHSQFSHVALVLKAKYTSQLLIWEASTNHAGLVDVQAGRVRTGVEVLPLRNKVFSGWYDRVAIRRLQNVTPEKRQQIYNTMLHLRKEWMGRSYEKNLLQMAVSAIKPSDTFLSLFQNTHEDLTSLFCSELVAAAYQRMELMKKEHPSNSFTPDDFSSARDSEILAEGVELSEEVFIELKWPPSLKSQNSFY